MLKAQQIFEVARDRGDAYVLIMQRQQENADSLTFALTGTWNQVQMARLYFKDYAYVHVMNTERDWEEHQEYLRGLGFKW